MASVVARLAPSPTGAQHLGNARTFLLAWLSARSRSGRIIFRLEDIDSPRVKESAKQQAIDDLRWLGLDWDEGPDAEGPNGPYIQSERTSRYQQVLQELAQSDAIYPCRCSRTDIENAASAPHWEHEGPVYPGTCRTRGVASKSTDDAWRFRASEGTLNLDDGYLGARTCNVQRELGDFVVAKRDGTVAYQLAVVVDDHDMEITEVVRGDDLLASAFRQIQLYRHLDWSIPTFYHVPLVVGSDGRRLAKRHGDSRLATYREQGVSSQRVIGLLAASLGLIDQREEVAPNELISDFRWEKVSRQDCWTFDSKASTWLTKT